MIFGKVPPPRFGTNVQDLVYSLRKRAFEQSHKFIHYLRLHSYINKCTFIIQIYPYMKTIPICAHMHTNIDTYIHKYRHATDIH